VRERRTRVIDSSNRAARVEERLRQAAAAHERMAARGAEAIVKAADAIVAAFERDGAVLVFGNGGSAAEAQHFVAELVGRYETERPGRRAIALTTDTSVLTAASNDYGFDRVFARQIEALGRRGDVALAITTSGRSANVLRGIETANARGLTTIALTGRDGARAAQLAAIHVNVAEQRTALAQEVHLTVLHVLCELIEEGLQRD